MEWWIRLNSPPSTFNSLQIEKLPCTAQSDGISCSILAVNSLEHYFWPSTKLRTDGIDSRITARGEAFLIAIEQKVRFFLSIMVLGLINT
jgi:hypothetical protein